MNPLTMSRRNSGPFCRRNSRIWHPFSVKWDTGRLSGRCWPVSGPTSMISGPRRFLKSSLFFKAERKSTPAGGPPISQNWPLPFGPKGLSSLRPLSVPQRKTPHLPRACGPIFPQCLLGTSSIRNRSFLQSCGRHFND